MNDFGRRGNSVVVKNLPANYTESQIEELFSKFGRIVSTKVLPSNPNFEGGCGFVNYTDADSCNKAVENMNNFVVDRFTLRVNHASARIVTQNGPRDSNDENNGRSSPSLQSRLSGFRPAANARSPITTASKTALTSNKSLWNSTNVKQQNDSKSSAREITTRIRDHDSFVTNKPYYVYLSNLEVPNIIYAATLDNYLTATLLIAQMNKHEQLAKVQANSYKSKLVVGQWCAALFNGDWYRARVIELDENRVRVQYIDWGNTGWCDSILEIRSLPNEYYKDPVLCVKCVLDGVPSNEKLSDEQMNAILEILVLDVKLEMIVLRVENDMSYAQINLGERNLNAEIRAILPQALTTIPSQSTIPLTDLHSNKSQLNQSEIHSVQLTTVDHEAECFHVLLTSGCLPTIMNVLKDWSATKQPLTSQPQPNMLVCAQYQGDDLWYRAWIENVTETGFHVYFVDFGNDEVVPKVRLSECPDTIRHLPWQSVQIKLANIQLTDAERYLLLKDFETNQLDMKILSKDQDIYSVELSDRGKSLHEQMLELRQKKKLQATSNTNEVPKASVSTASKITLPMPAVKNVSRSLDQNVHPVSLPIQQVVKESNNSSTRPPSTTTSSTKLSINSDPISKQPLVVYEQNGTNFIAMITEQRRQNRLLEQVIAGINTTNTLLTQLMQQ